jgi:oxygen-independent coproporphyrinogen-3 oxidase
MAGLYIHIPFCAQRCAYCDFYKSTDTVRVAEFLDALKREMIVRQNFLERSQLSTIYVGGGTPSTLSLEQLQGLLEYAAGEWDCSSLKEVTLEANPEDLSDDYIFRLADTAFNRLSIGIQSFDDRLLRLMNRRHDAARAKNAVRAAQKVGFDNITIDLIYGIPGMTHDQWEHSLDEAIALGVQHISAYHLTIEPGTTFGKMALRDEGNKSPAAFRPVHEVESERQYEILRRKLGDVGFEHYEISNFALHGRRAVHNSAYWSGEPYLGIGPSAHSFDGERRREWVVSDVGEYISEVGTDAIYEGETLTDGELFNERIMTTLRTSGGLDLAQTERIFGREHMAGLVKNSNKFISKGLLQEKEGKLTIPPEKFLLSDYIISSLFEE